jgi:hypothetical protein
MYKKIRHLVVWSLFLAMIIGCSENPTAVVEQENNQLLKSGSDEVLAADVFLRGYVTLNGKPLKNQRLQILDENKNPFNYFPYNQLVDVVYTNSSGYYFIQVCGFNPGLRHVTSTYNGKTFTYGFTIPYERNGDVYITKNFKFNSAIYDDR